MPEHGWLARRQFKSRLEHILRCVSIICMIFKRTVIQPQLRTQPILEHPFAQQTSCCSAQSHVCVTPCLMLALPAVTVTAAFAPLLLRSRLSPYPRLLVAAVSPSRCLPSPRSARAPPCRFAVQPPKADCRLSLIARPLLSRPRPAYAASPTTFALTSHRRRAFSSSLTSSDTWFWKLPVSRLQDQYTPLSLRLGLDTTCDRRSPASSSET